MRDAKLTEYARGMRRQATPAEQTLWLALRAKRFHGVQFRRQKVIGSYIVDFASNDPRLIIEIDGESHGSQAEYDKRRTAELNALGYAVLRFSNSDVLNNLEGVLIMIAELLSPSPNPLPERGEG